MEINEIVEVLEEIVTLGRSGIIGDKDIEAISSAISILKSHQALKEGLLGKLPKEKSLIRCPHGEIYVCEDCTKQNEFIRTENHIITQVKQVINEL